MIRSMTGFSRVEDEAEGFALTVSIRATNHRFFDPQLRLPSSIEALEPTTRRLLKEHISRGHVEITVGFSSAGGAELEIDRKLLAAYQKGYQLLKREFGATGEPDLMALLRIPGMVATGNGEMTRANAEGISKLAERAVTRALEKLNAMRTREGESLERDLLARFGRLEVLCASVAQLAREAPRYYKQRLEGRIRDLTGSAEMDGARLAQEVAYLASRSDIAEELTRFQSHLDQIRHLLSESSEVGKKLDFLLQEMNREANTLLSKTTDVPEVGLEITRQAIEMKTEIEKLREQAQNIE
jgi:uncharacterized protein (TIGR00255 family)